MWKKIKIVLWSLFGIGILIFLSLGVFIYKARYGINFYDSNPPVVSSDISGKTVLVFSKTNGFRHGVAIEASLPAYEKIAQNNGWKIYATDNGAIFNNEQLALFDVVIWNNCSGIVLNKEQRESFKNFIGKGGGFIGIHASGDNSHQWDWYEKEILGAKFSHHPIKQQFQIGEMFLEAENKILSTNLPESWQLKEEWYMFYDSPRKNGFKVLYALDETNIDPNGNLPLLVSDKDWGMGEDHPVVWYHQLGDARIVYSSIGHSATSFEDKTHLKILENAIRWVGKFED